MLEVTGDLLSSWGSLHQRAIEQNPFFEPPCVVPPAASPARRTESNCSSPWTAKPCSAACPSRSLPRWHWSRRGTLTSNVRRLKWLGTPLLDRNRADEAMTAMLAHLRDRRGQTGARLLALEWMHAGGPVAEVLRRTTSELGLPLGYGEQFERPGFLRLPDGFGRRAATPGPPVPLGREEASPAGHKMGAVSLVERSGDPTLPGEVIALEASGYKHAAGIALQAWPGEPAWFTAMVTGPPRPTNGCSASPWSPVTGPWPTRWG